MADQSVGDWILGDPIGEGETGRVYVGCHATTGEWAAIKEIAPILTQEPGFHERFLEAGRQHVGLEHPKIVRVFDAFESDGRYYLVMEYVSGRSLGQVVAEQGGPVEIPLAVDWIRQTLSALDFAHSRSIIHRNLNPYNLVVTDSGEVKVMDFLLGLVLGDARELSTGEILGDPYYLSPEQIYGPSRVVSRSDIYSLGGIFYFLLAGKPPFAERSALGAMEANLNADRVSLRMHNRNVPQLIDRIVLQMLERELPARYRSCQVVAEALDTAERLTRDWPKPLGTSPRAAQWEKGIYGKDGKREAPRPAQVAPAPPLAPPEPPPSAPASPGSSPPPWVLGAPSPTPAQHGIGMRIVDRFLALRRGHQATVVATGVLVIALLGLLLVLGGRGEIEPRLVGAWEVTEESFGEGGTMAWVWQEGLRSYTITFSSNGRWERRVDNEALLTPDEMNGTGSWHVAGRLPDGTLVIRMSEDGDSGFAESAWESFLDMTLGRDEESITEEAERRVADHADYRCKIESNDEITMQLPAYAVQSVDRESSTARDQVYNARVIKVSYQLRRQ